MSNPVAGLRFKSWSASRLDDYTLCPRKAAHKHLQKLCPLCFNGSVNKGQWPNQVCGSCGKARPMPEALARGSRIGASLETYVNGTAKSVDDEVRNPQALALAKSLRAAHKKGKVKLEFTLNFDQKWRLLPPQWTPEIWLIVKMDVWHWTGDTTGMVIDWKTGGVDRGTGKIYASEKYNDQLLAYQVAALSAYPRADEVRAGLCFVDAAGDPRVERPNLKRLNLKAAQAKLTKLALPMMTDDTFAPRPNEKCRWCEYSKGRGGPCPF